MDVSLLKYNLMLLVFVLSSDTGIEEVMVEGVSSIEGEERI